MAVACGIDADADAIQRSRRHRGFLATKSDAGWVASGNRDVRCEIAREPPPRTFGETILVMSGRSRMMYQYLVAKDGGDNLF